MKKQAITYLIAGAWNTFFGIIILIYSNKMLNHVLNPMLIFSFSSVISVLQAFFIQRKFVWISKNNLKKEIMRFFTLVSVNYLINLILLAVLVSRCKLSFIPTQIFITASLGVSGYFISRHWVFKKRDIDLQ